jgi:uncharacterized membrane protein
MDRQHLDHYLGTFCHLDPERAFSFDSVLSLLCHRCTSIYSTFLIVTLFALLFSWRGQVLKWTSQFSLGCMAIGFLALCGLQVAVQEFFHPWGGGEQARILTGSFVAIGLFQLSQLSKEEASPKVGTWLQLFLLIGAIAFHLLMIRLSFIYNSMTTVVGLIWLYHQINAQVLEPWISKKSFVFRHGILITMILLEWSALFAINVMKIHV